MTELTTGQNMTSHPGRQVSMFTARVCRAQQASSPGQRKAAPHCPLKVSVGKAFRYE